MLYKIKRKLFEKKVYYSGGKYIRDFNKNKGQKKIYFLSTPSHGNMGDQAIAEASVLFFNKYFPEYEVIEVYREDVNKYAYAIKKVIKPHDLVFIHGGGNMGTLYPWEEETRRQIIKLFKKNPIISMPQTISFTNDEFGKKELEKSKKVYNNHSNLKVIAREKLSYTIMNEAFKEADVILNPDIVLFLFNQFEADNTQRDHIMTCLRNDKESVLGQKKQQFLDELSQVYSDVFNYDTVINEKVYRESRTQKLNGMFNEFRKSKVVITDRLHGMVFCAITKTPCIVTKSLDHKVTGTYEWIRELNYIKLVDNLEFSEVNKLIQELSNLESFTSINLNECYFSKLRNKLEM